LDLHQTTIGIQAEKRERALVLETNRMTDKLDALLTLTELSLLAHKGVLQFAIPVVSIQSLTNCPADQ
jgi:hypothetical protein